MRVFACVCAGVSGFNTFPSRLVVTTNHPTSISHTEKAIFSCGACVRCVLRCVLPYVRVCLCACVCVYACFQYFFNPVGGCK